MSFNAFSLMAKLGLDTNEYEKGLTTAESTASSFGSSFSAVMGGVGIATAAVGTAVTLVGTATYKTGKAIVDATADVAEYGDNIDKMSQKMGISATAYQEWDAVMQHCGTSMDSLKASMKTLATQAEQGDEAFAKLGITEEELATLNQEDLFSRVITGLQEMEEGTERTALTSQLLGRGATELGALLNMTAEDTQAMKDRIHELGGVMSDDAVKASAQFQDNLQDMNTAIDGLKRSILSELLPSFNDLIDGFTKLITGEEGADEAIVSGIDKLITGAGNIADKAVGIIADIFPRLISGISSRFPELISAVVSMMTDTVPMLIDSINNDLIPAVMEAIPTIMASYIEKLPEMMQQSMDMAATFLPMVIDTAVQLLVAFAEAYEEMMPIIYPLSVELLTILVNTLLDNLPLIFDAAVALMLGMYEGIISMLPELISAAVQIVMKIVATVIELIPHIIAAAVKIVTEFLTTCVMTGLKFLNGDYWKKMLDGIIHSFTDIDWAGLGKMLTDGIANGIKNNFTKIKDAVTNIAEGIKNLFKDLFDIHSPSKVFEYYGRMLDDGLAKGINGDESPMIAMEDLSNKIEGSFKISPKVAPQVNPWGAGASASIAPAIGGRINLASDGVGDITIPIYIGSDLIDTVVVKAIDRANYRSGGR